MYNLWTLKKFRNRKIYLNPTIPKKVILSTMTQTQVCSSGTTTGRKKPRGNLTSLICHGRMSAGNTQAEKAILCPQKMGTDQHPQHHIPDPPTKSLKQNCTQQLLVHCLISWFKSYFVNQEESSTHALPRKRALFNLQLQIASPAFFPSTPDGIKQSTVASR